MLSTVTGRNNNRYPRPATPEAGRSSFNPYMKKMVCNSYIHGLREIYWARTRQEKIFWIFICATCCALATYEITQVIIQFQQKSIVTKIDIDTMTNVAYPTVLLCPTKWLNSTRVKEFRVDKEVVHYLLSLFESIIPMPTMDIKYTNMLPQKIHTALERTKSRTLSDLAKNLTINASNLYCNPACCRMDSVEKIVTLIGVCFAFDLCESSFQSREKSPNFLLKINVSDSEEQQNGLVNGGYLAFYENKQQITPAVHDVIVLTADTMSVIKLGLNHIRRISTWKKPCHKSNQVKIRATCEFDCIDSIENKICYNCSKYSMFDENSTLAQCAGWLSPTFKKHTFEKDLLQCKSKCLTACEQKIYVVQSVTSVNFPNRHTCGQDPHLDCLQVVLYFPLFTDHNYEDVQTLNFDSFISQVGGQTGLWCGASIVSICQVISYFCCPCLHWSDLKETYYNMRNTSMKRKYHKRRHSDVPLKTTF